MQQLIRDVGVPVGMLIFIILAGARGVWVYGWVHKKEVEALNVQLTECKDERDEWKEAALQGTMLAADAVGTAEVVRVRPKGARKK